MANIEIKYSKKSNNTYKYSAISCFAIAIISAVILFISDSPLISPYGIGSLWFIVTAFILLSLKYFPILTIGDMGLNIGSFKTVIPWKKIERVSIRSFLFQKFLMIKYEKSSAFIKDRTFLFLYKILFFWLHFGYDFSINISSLELEPDEILSIIKSRIRDQKSA